MGDGGEDGWKWKGNERMDERRGGARKDKMKVKGRCDREKTTAEGQEREREREQTV